MSTLPESVTESTTEYLQRLGIRMVYEVCDVTRVLLARSLMYELPKLELVTQGRFAAARTELFNILSSALDAVDPHGTLEVCPGPADLATQLRLLDCEDKDVQATLNSLLAKLDEGTV